MKAMVLEKIVELGEETQPLTLRQRPVPEPGSGQVLIAVSACGVCHTELDEIEGRAAPARLPVIPGHQVVGTVEACGADVTSLSKGNRVGVAWINFACGRCGACRRGLENLCKDFKATGRDADGGYAEYMTVDARFAYPIPQVLTDTQAAPLLCAGAIGLRSLRLTGLQDGQRLGLTGFGASAHLVLKLVRHRYPTSEIYVFARSEKEQAFARELGAVWAGPTRAQAPAKLHAIIDTTPAWTPVVSALGQLVPGGRLVINAIRKEQGDQDQLLSLDYASHLWLEKEVKSVANVTRRDVIEFLDLAAGIPIQPEVRTYALEEANQALVDLKKGHVRGAKVLLLR